MSSSQSSSVSSGLTDEVARRQLQAHRRVVEQLERFLVQDQARRGGVTVRSGVSDEVSAASVSTNSPPGGTGLAAPLSEVSVRSAVVGDTPVSSHPALNLALNGGPVIMTAEGGISNLNASGLRPNGPFSHVGTPRDRQGEPQIPAWAANTGQPWGGGSRPWPLQWGASGLSESSFGSVNRRDDQSASVLGVRGGAVGGYVFGSSGVSDVSHSASVPGGDVVGVGDGIPSSVVVVGDRPSIDPVFNPLMGNNTDSFAAGISVDQQPGRWFNINSTSGYITGGMGSTPNVWETPPTFAPRFVQNIPRGEVPGMRRLHGDSFNSIGSVGCDADFSGTDLKEMFRFYKKLKSGEVSLGLGGQLEYGEEFLNSLKLSEGEPTVIGPANGSSVHAVVNVDGKKFSGTVLKLDNSILIHANDTLFLNRVFIPERAKLVARHGGLMNDSVMVDGFVDSALEQSRSRYSIEEYLKSLSDLGEFKNAHVLYTVDKHFEVFNQFVRGEFTLVNLFVKGSPTVDMSKKFNLFSVYPPPFPTKDTHMLCDLVVSWWIRFLEAVCWVPKDFPIQWGEVFDDFVSRLRNKDLKMMTVNFFLDCLNHVLFEWFKRVKAPFFWNSSHYAFTPLLSPMLLLKDLLRKVQFDLRSYQDFCARELVDDTVCCVVESGAVGQCYVNSKAPVGPNHSGPVVKPLVAAQNVCMAHVCKELLRVDSGVLSCKPNREACARFHPALTELPKLKSKILTTLKMLNLPKTWCDMVTVKLEEVCESA